MLVAQALRGYFQPDAVDRIFTQVEKFQSYVRTDQTIAKFLTEFGILRRKAEEHMFPAGGDSPDIYIRFLCTKAAQLQPKRKDPLDGQHGGPN